MHFFISLLGDRAYERNAFSPALLPHPVAFDEGGIDTAVDEGGVSEDLFVQGNGGLDSIYHELM